MQDIIDKILNVKDNNSLRITETDKAYCELMQKYFQETIANLDKWEKLFNGSLEDEFKDRHSTYLNYHGKPRYNNKAAEENELLGYMFFPGDSLEELQGKREEVTREFISCILNHFNETYDLYLSVDEMDEPERVKNYSEVVDWIFSRLDSSSLQEHRLQILIKNFREAACMFGNKATLVKSRIEFGRMRGMFDHCRSGHEFSDTDKHFQHFMYGLGYFETGKVEHMPASTMTNGQKVNFNHNYTFPNSEKLSSVKFYKNGKAILSFKSERDALACYGSFGLE